MKTLDKSAIDGGLRLPNPHGVETTTIASDPVGGIYGFEWRSTREPEYHVYLFNISRRAFNNVGLIRLNAPGIDVPAKDGSSVKRTLPGMENKPYRYITSFPQPMLFPKLNFDTNQFDFVEQDVRRFVVDLISPDMAGAITLDNPVNPAHAWSEGKDFARAGLFFDYSETPSPEALEKAYARLDTYYKALLEQARTFGLTNKPLLEEKIRDNPDYVFAAEYMGEEFDWCKRQTRSVECTNCGERKTTTKPFHKSAEGFLCVDPTPEAWKQAYNVGLVQKDRVPEDFRWWSEKKNAFNPLED